MSEQEAIKLLREAGYRVSKIKPKAVKDRVGPTFVAGFADGEVTRMSIFTSLQNLDVGRGVRLAKAAYESRCKDRPVPEIMTAAFEQDGVIIAKCTAEARALT